MDGETHLRQRLLCVMVVEKAVPHFTGRCLHSIYGTSYRLKDRFTMEDLTFLVQHVMRYALDALSVQMQRNNVDRYFGTARFGSPYGPIKLPHLMA